MPPDTQNGNYNEEGAKKVSDDGGSRDYQVLTNKKEKLVKPGLFKVLLHNDDYTTMDFVVMVLKTIFKKSETEAIHVMLSVHKKGVGIAGVYPYDIAETKVLKVHIEAEKYEHPLRATMEPE